MTDKAVCLRLLLFIVLSFSPCVSGAQEAPGKAETYPAIRVKGQAQPAVTGLVPDQVRNAYGFNLVVNQGAGQTIGIVNAYNHPHIEEDLAFFSQTFGLSPCTASNGCFQKVYAPGANPAVNQLWALEAALDVEWAHAIAPQAKIVFVVARSARLVDMIDAVDFAVQNGATVVSMSWGTTEFAGETAFNNRFVAANVTFIAASGDSGTGALYPAASPNVVGVGGTTLSVDSQGNYLGEIAWSGSGGGRSSFESEPAYQSLYGIPFETLGRRVIPDVAYNADPETGFAVYTSLPYFGFHGWLEIGGTSAGAPQWAGLIAVANSMRLAGNKYPLTGAHSALYTAAKESLDSNFHDITSGTNGTCGLLCTAVPDFDAVTGLGSPRAHSLINALIKLP